MPQVKNWQLNRAMEYPYEEVRPRRQVAYVFDTNKCIACQTCTFACKTTWTSGKGQETMFWNNVETKPYGFYPTAWDVNLLDLLGAQTWKGRTYAGKTVFESAPPGERVLGHHPDEQDYAHANLGEDDAAGLVQKGAYFTGIHSVWMFYLARICNHCTFPACVAACPRKAIYKREEDGVVLVDQTRCRGYRECVKACPYKKVFFNLVTRVSEKCIACYPRLEQGLQPRCVESCIGKIRMQGWLSKPGEPRQDNPLDYLVHVRKVALPLYPQYGTEPNVYYVPPVHVPREFLLQLFGPGVDEAIRTYRAAKDDPNLLGAMLLFGNSPVILERYEVQDGHAIGYDGSGREAIRVPLTEPVYVRPYRDDAHQTFRHNTA